MGVAVAKVVIALLAATPASAAAPVESHVASCEQGPVMMGSGSADWRRTSAAAGPLGVPSRGLGSVNETRNGHFLTKLPVLVEGSHAVTLSVPPRLRQRVFLYYGERTDRQGRSTTSFRGYPGDPVVEFHPCAHKPRTLWPGGIRVKGRAPVRLLVSIEGRPKPIPLPLGRPVPVRRG